jgi:hypothetical protein
MVIKQVRLLMKANKLDKDLRTVEQGLKLVFSLNLNQTNKLIVWEGIIKKTMQIYYLKSQA